MGLAFLFGGNLVFAFVPGLGNSAVLAKEIHQDSKSDLLCSQSLSQWIEQHLAQPPLRKTRWGLDIRALNRDGQEARPLYQRNSEQFFLPASSAKLFTAATLAGHFNQNYRLSTKFQAVGEAPNLQTLTVVGAGDPTILDPQLEPVVQALKTRGIRTIGELVADSRAFAAPWIIPSWEWEDLLTSDGVPITSLSFSQNSLPLKLTPQSQGEPLALEWLDGTLEPPLRIKNETMTVASDAPEFVSLVRDLSGTTLTVKGHLREGASPDVSYVAIANPEEYFLWRFRKQLERAGIKVERLSVLSQGSPSPDSSAKSQVITRLESPPLSDLLKEVNQSSNNFYTESLLRHWAWTVQSGDEPVTPRQSLEKLEQYLSSMGVSSDGYQLQDASGLSRQNLVSPGSLSQLLAAVQSWQQGTLRDRRQYQTLKDSLAVSGESGTLKRRLTQISGRFYGKTGTLRGTVAIAGILEKKDGSAFAVTIMANQSDLSSSQLRKAVDAIILQLDQSAHCAKAS